MLSKLKAMRDTFEEGFTLIELLVVIVIIGILAAIALPIFLNQQKAAFNASLRSDVKTAIVAVGTFLVKKPTASAAEINTVVGLSPKSDGNTLYSAYDWQGWTIVGYRSNSTNNPYTTGYYRYFSTTGKSLDNLQ